MQFDVVIPTRGSVDTINSILHCISIQSLLPQYVILVVNGFSGTKEESAASIEDIIPDNLRDRLQLLYVLGEYSGNASYARNLGCQHAISPYVYFLDDDNTFGQHFFASSVAEYTILKSMFAQDILYSPTILWRMSDTIQSQGIKAFHALCGWLEPVQFGGWKSGIVHSLRILFPLPKIYHRDIDYTRATAIGGNSLLSSRNLFTVYPFDEHISFVYEDIDMSYRMTKANVPLIVSNKVTINHMERNKNKIQQSFLANSESAYNKSRNRIIFVKKNCSLQQKILFFTLGLPITSCMSLIFILLQGGQQRFSIALSYIRGIRAGIGSK